MNKREFIKIFNGQNAEKLKFYKYDLQDFYKKYNKYTVRIYPIMWQIYKGINGNKFKSLHARKTIILHNI